MVLVAVDENKVDPAYLSVVKDNTVVFVGVVLGWESTPLAPKPEK
jgi:hypothetical protein